MKKIYAFGGQKGENKPSELQNQYGRVIHLSIGNFILMKKKCAFEDQKGKNKPQSPKTELGFQNQNGTGRPGKTAQGRIDRGRIVRGISQSFCVLYLSFGA
jgi:hypothetical protein